MAQEESEVNKAVWLLLINNKFNIQNDGEFQHTGNLSTENHTRIVGNILGSAKLMCQIVSDKLNHLAFIINVTGDFGKWVTENENTTLVLSIDTQV
jgi:hypothetical protein